MKKAKNIILLIGVVVIVLSSAFLTYNFFSLLDFTSMDAEYNFYSYQLPMTIISAFLVLPILLFVRNLMGKTGKVLPIISVVVNSIFLVTTLCLSVMVKMPSFLIGSKLSLVETFTGSVISYFVGSEVLLIIAFALIVVGSVLSLPKKRS